MTEPRSSPVSSSTDSQVIHGHPPKPALLLPTEGPGPSPDPQPTGTPGKAPGAERGVASCHHHPTRTDSHFPQQRQATSAGLTAPGPNVHPGAQRPPRGPTSTGLTAPGPTVVTPPLLSAQNPGVVTGARVPLPRAMPLEDSPPSARRPRQKATAGGRPRPPAPSRPPGSPPVSSQGGSPGPA